MSATIILWYQHAEGGAKHGFGWPFPGVISAQIAERQLVPCAPPFGEPGAAGVLVRKIVRKVLDKDGVEQEITSFDLLDEIPQAPEPESAAERRERLLAELAALDEAEGATQTSPGATQRADLPAPGEDPKPKPARSRARTEE